MTTTTILSDNGVSSGSAGIKTTGGNDGTLALQTTTSGGTATAGITINNVQGVLVPNTIGVGGATPSTSGAGITFPATQSASSDPNTLDDYEEGTWTPTWGTAGFTATGATFSNARYVKIGRQVFVEVAIALTGTSGNFTAGDGFSIGGMPFGNDNICSAGTCWNSSNWTAGTRATGIVMAYAGNIAYMGIEFASGTLRSQTLLCAVVYEI